MTDHDNYGNEDDAEMILNGVLKYLALVQTLTLPGGGTKYPAVTFPLLLSFSAILFSLYRSRRNSSCFFVVEIF